MITLGVVMTKSPTKLAFTKGGIIPWNHADRGLGPIPEDPVQFPRTTSTQKPFTLEGVAPMKSFSFSGVKTTKTSLAFIRTCWPRFRLPQGWKVLQCGHGCDEPSLS